MELYTTTTLHNGIKVTLFFLLLLTCHLSHGQRYMEYLDRGTVAVRRNANEVLVSWRSLATDPATISFNVYRDGAKVNSNPITSSTNFVDNTASNGTYTVRAIINDIEQDPSDASTAWSQPFLTIPIQQPAGGRTPDNVDYTYVANDCSVGDLDGDGQYEIILKWDPTNAKDNAHSGYTGNVFLDAYELDGTLLWRIDLGKNIRAGAHYTQFMVYDLDSDGKAEVACKTADGTISGTGELIGSATADHRNTSGYILSGPEYLTIFNGETGGILATTDYVPARGSVSSWGDNYGNRVDRFLACIAYLDGTKPSLVMCRGYYTRAVLAAWDWRNGQLTQRWVFDSRDGTPGNTAYEGQGAHSLTVGDVDDDGKDEIVYGACAIDDDGTGLYTTGLGHGDALHMSDMDPDRPGLEVWMVHESPSSYGAAGLEFRDAKTGGLIFGISGENVDVGRGAAFDIDPRYKGYEMWGSRGRLYSATGTQISLTRPSQMNFCVWWDGDLLREILDGTTISKWNHLTSTSAEILSAQAYNGASNNGTKATPALSADILGDWREEVIWRRDDNQALLLFSTSIPTATKLPTLMHDPQYRLAVAWQNVAYNQPPHPGFFLGHDMDAPTLPSIVYNTPPRITVEPAMESRYEPGSDIVINATATDADGTITKVEFFKDGQKIEELTEAPYTITLNNVATGIYNVRIAATDDYGTTINSKIELLVNTLPLITVTSPTDGFLYQENNAVTIQVDASDADGTVSNVEFFEGDQKLGEDNTAPYSFSWTTIGIGTHTITAKVTDDLGSSTISDEITFRVNGLPTASITLPTNSSTFPVESDVVINVSATDADGTISNVEFYQNDIKLGEDQSLPYTYVWTTIPEGTFELTARVTDNDGGIRITNPVTIVAVITSTEHVVQRDIVSPNPSSSFFILRAHHSFSYTVFDNLGRVAEEGKGEGLKTIGSDLLPGCYVLQVNMRDTKQHVRIIKY